MRRLLASLLLLAGLLQPVAATAPPPPPAPSERVDPNARAVYASRRSNVYHRVGCRYIRQIHPENLISFPSIAEAQKSGYRACKVGSP